jgi:hypothetical protein
MTGHRKLAITAGVSFVVIFVAAIFANFIALEALMTDPLTSVTDNALMIRLGIMAFLVAAVGDVVVAWALKEMYWSQSLSVLSTYFRLIHATLMGAGVFALVEVLSLSSKGAILDRVEIFNNLWLIGLFFFGIHLLILGWIVRRIKIIPWLLVAAGVMYIVDTSAHFLLASYADFAGIMLIAVAVPAVLGEMSFAVWLLWKGGKDRLD